MSVRRGDIYWVAFDPVKGSEQGGLRPAVVVQNDVGNRYSPTTIVAAITRTLPPRPYPFTVIVSPEESGLPEVSLINCGQLATIQQAGPASRLRPPRGEDRVRPIGRVSDERMRDVNDALRFSLELS
ncbi:MAG: type II toxin-antitoxin system PemK/MazF family toxin [Chloroflexi bacterium]|nr:type II toxin-antitoxin system PemK/MazF family toxin [Chloroflexota bacterium]